MERREELVQILIGVLASPAIQPSLGGHIFNINELPKEVATSTIKIAEEIQRQLDEKFNDKKYADVVAKQFALE